MKNGKIAFLDLIAPHEELKEELLEVFLEALRTGAFVGGAMVESFERDFAGFCDTQHCIGVASGTDALRFALIAAGVGPGDVVLTVPNTFIATGEAISQCGARPEFVDIDERTYNLDPLKLEQYLERECTCDLETGTIRSRRSPGLVVKAIVPVHIYGQTADMDPILELAERYGLTVVEDACQAHGAEYYSEKDGGWRRAGSIGRAAAFSFYPGKNLGACGEGGAVTTNDAALAQKVRMLRDHGQAQKYYHDIEGYNGRLDAIQAGILQVKLRRLTGWNEQRRECARRYDELLAPAAEAAIAPWESAWSKAVYHLYVVRVQNRTELQRELGEAGIGTAIHYPVPLHLQKAYEGLGYQAGDFPVAEQVAGEILSLPMFPGLTHSQQSRVAERFLSFVLPRARRTAAAAGAGD